MLDSLIYFTYFLLHILYTTLQISWKIGYFIIITLQTIYGRLFELTSAIAVAVVILFEDFTVFSTDLYTKFNVFLIGIVQAVDNTFGIIYNVFEFIKNGATNVWGVRIKLFQQIFTALNIVCTSIVSILQAVIHGLLLFGSGVWFAVTFIPLIIIYLCTYAGELLKKWFDLVVMFSYTLVQFLIEMINFFIDVPIESIIGLFIGFCITLAVVKCHIVIYKSARKYVLKFVKTMKKKLVKPPVSSPPGKNGSCIICFERNRCLVTMPCRHLCMCERCWERIENHGIGDVLKCPVCRSGVQYTIRVY